MSWLTRFAARDRDELWLLVGTLVLLGVTLLIVNLAGEVLEEPDKLSITFTLGPRVFMAKGGVARTALLDKGSRVEYRDQRTVFLKLRELRNSW